MRVVGKERVLPATNQPSLANLVAADRFMASLRGMCGRERRHFPQGVYCYHSHDAADAALLEAVARDMARLMIERERGSGKVRT